ncbi:MAG: DUF2283 domain-containing protein [Chloroflexi bacterium]|nr:DUF2283 domain-containing protein [Chloroflexota bacterium]
MDKKMRLLYDREAEVLYISIGHPEFTDYEQVGENLILRHDPKTGRIVGFTIIDFAARFAQKESPLSVPINATLEPVSKPRKTRVVAESKAVYRAKRPSNKTRRSAAKV